MKRGSVSALVCALALACSDPPPRRDEPRAREPAAREAEAAESPAGESPAEPEAAESPEPAPSCTLEAPFATLSVEAEGDAIALARHPTGSGASAIVLSSPTGYRLIQSVGDTLVSAIPSVEGAPIEGTLLGLEPMGPDFLLLTLGPCATPDAARCLRAHLLHAGEGGALSSSPPIELAQAGQLRSIRVTATDGLVYVARSYRDARPTLDRFAPPLEEGEGLRHTSITVGEGLSDDEPVEMLALAADGAAWALLYRHGATEDPESGVVLATQLDEHHVEVLHDALVVESISWVGTSIAAVVAFEFARPAYLRIAADGEVRVSPREIEFGADIPEPFGSRLVARAIGSAGDFAIEVRNGAGDRYGERIALEDARTVDVARAPGGFLLAWTAGGALHLARLRC